MKKNLMKIMTMLLMAMMLSACGNSESKVDQVVQDQIQAAEEANVETTEAAVDAPTLIAETEEEEVYVKEPDSSVDVDLTALSSTMVYSEVYNMLTVPEGYIGKSVKMSGMFVIYSNQEQTQYYPAVIIADATACCSQGLEFLLEGNPEYPDGYPELETDITVTGTFETYEEDGSTYCRLKDAKLV